MYDQIMLALILASPLAIPATWLVSFFINPWPLGSPLVWFYVIVESENC